MDIVKILVLAICVLVPYTGVMAIIAILATRAKWKSAHQTLKDIETGMYKNSQTSKGLLAYIIISLALVLVLSCAMVITFAYYLNFSTLTSDIDFETLRIFLIILLMLGIVGTGILWVWWEKSLSSK